MSAINSLRIVRDMSDEQASLAQKAQAEARNTDAAAHWYAHRTLHALSATTAKVTEADAIRWMASERRHAGRLACEQAALESGYAATILEHLAIALRSAAIRPEDRDEPCPLRAWHDTNDELK